MLKQISEKALDTLIERFPALSSLREQIIASVLLLAETYAQGAKLLICGNGGSAGDSLHIVGELMKSFTLSRPLPLVLIEELRRLYPEDASYYEKYLQQGVPAISLVSETSLITAYTNDAAADLVFAQQVVGYGARGDVLLAISTSGNSANVLHAVQVAKAKGISVISMTGQSGGKLGRLSDVLLNVPSNVTHHIQELHLPLYHGICQMLEMELFGELG